MHIEAELKAFKARLDPRIEAYFDVAIKESAKEDDLVTEALGHVKELALSGGKRLRAAFMYYGYLAAGGREEEKMLETAVSIELIHLFLLIHDDIIDRDGMRHGVATLHERYADIGRRFFPQADARHFGNSIAIIMGDMVSAFGNDVIFRSDFPKERVFAALSKLQNIISFTVIGQARDVYMEYKGEASEEEILRMYRNKTAKYTVEGPLHLGGILAGADQSVLDGFSAYAIPLGIAFQIQDDILGVFATEKRLGKPVGSDIVEGKITLLVSRALRDSSRKQGKRLKELLGLGERLTEKDVEEFQGIIRETGALAGAKALADGYIQEGRTALEGLKEKIEPRAYDFLVSVADYMANRDC